MIKIGVTTEIQPIKHLSINGNSTIYKKYKLNSLLLFVEFPPSFLRGFFVKSLVLQSKCLHVKNQCFAFYLID